MVSLKSIGMVAGMGSTIGSFGAMGYVGYGASLEDAGQKPNPWEMGANIRLAKGAILGAGIGGLAGLAIGQARSGSLMKRLGRPGLVGAVAGVGIGLIGSAITNAKIRRGAFTGGSMGAVNPQTRMSSSLASVAQLRADIARLHRPIKGIGY